MGRFKNTTTGVTFSVDDSKDGRYGDGFEPASEEKAPTKRTTKASSASDDK